MTRTRSVRVFGRVLLVESNHGTFVSFFLFIKYRYIYTKQYAYKTKYALLHYALKQKQKYRGMFETQKSRNKTSSGDIGLNIRTLASPKVGQDQVSGGVSVPCRHATPVADHDALWKPIFSNNVKVGKKSSQGKVS